MAIFTIKSTFVRMKQTKAFLLTYCVAVFCLSLWNGSIVYAQKTPELENEANIFSRVISPTPPESVQFCDENYDLSRYDAREHMEREMLSFCYMHSTTLQIIKKANRYFPIIIPILKEEGIPEDFKYLMVIESSLNTKAYSRAGAAGLWQLMPTTGRELGLEVNANIDERYNIYKSTKAACKYLKKRYSKFNNWGLVAQSYNAGEAGIAKQISRQHSTDPLDLYLNSETSRYFFRILACKYLFKKPSAMGFYLSSSQLYPPLKYTTKTITYPISDLAKWAQQNGTTYSLLKQANPWLRQTSLQNRTRRTYILKIPTKSSMYYTPSDTRAYDTNWVIGKNK